MQIKSQSSLFSFLTLSCGALALLCACSSTPKPLYQSEQFDSKTSPFARNFNVGAAATCQAARRALLSQGYMTTSTRFDLVDGTKNFQPDGDSHVTIEFHVVCTSDDPDSTNGTAYVSAVQDRYTLKKTSTSASVGLSVLGSLSLPIGSSDDSMVKIASETIPAGVFYDRFFNLVKYYIDTAPEKPAPVKPVAPPLPMPDPVKPPHAEQHTDGGAANTATPVSVAPASAVPAIVAPSVAAPVSASGTLPGATAPAATPSVVPAAAPTVTPSIAPAAQPAQTAPSAQAADVTHASSAATTAVAPQTDASHTVSATTPVAPATASAAIAQTPPAAVSSATSPAAIAISASTGQPASIPGPAAAVVSEAAPVPASAATLSSPVASLPASPSTLTSATASVPASAAAVSSEAASAPVATTAAADNPSAATGAENNTSASPSPAK